MNRPYNVLLDAMLSSEWKHRRLCRARGGEKAAGHRYSSRHRESVTPYIGVDHRQTLIGRPCSTAKRGVRLSLQLRLIKPTVKAHVTRARAHTHTHTHTDTLTHRHTDTLPCSVVRAGVVIYVDVDSVVLTFFL